MSAWSFIHSVYKVSLCIQYVARKTVENGKDDPRPFPKDFFFFFKKRKKAGEDTN